MSEKMTAKKAIQMLEGWDKQMIDAKHRYFKQIAELIREMDSKLNPPECSICGSAHTGDCATI